MNVCLVSLTLLLVPLRCLPGQTPSDIIDIIPQAVIRWKHSDDVSDSFCGLPVDLSNWHTSLHLSVSAMFDSLVDSDWSRNLAIYEFHYDAAGNAIYHNKITTLEVNI